MKLAAKIVAATAVMSAVAAHAQPRSSQLNGYVTFTTDYRNRGLSQTDGEPALQFGIDYQHRDGWFVGAFTSNVEYAADTTRVDERETELDLYLGYDRQFADWALTATLARYAYTGSGDRYGELTAGIRYRDRIYLTTSRASGFGPGDLDVSNHELTLIVPLRWALELGATIGRARIEQFPSSAYSHWNIGLSKLVGPASIDLRFFDNSYGITTYIGGAQPDQWVLSVTYSFLGS